MLAIPYFDVVAMHRAEGTLQIVYEISKPTLH